MSLLKKLFGSKTTGKDPAPDSPAFRGGPIKAFDKFGREINISRSDWYHSVLKDNLKNAWDDPDKLAGLLVSAFNDDFIAAVEDAAARLYKIDTDPERGACMLAAVYLDTSRPGEAESLLKKYVKRHGASGIILTNLAKAQSKLGREDESLQTLWRALEIDPNQDNGLLWYTAICKEKDGEEAELAALRRIAALPGSWRAQLWIARSALEARNLDEALELYQSALVAAGDPSPYELLRQMSGDLGTHGHLPELINLTAPRFDVAFHGLAVGNNLIKASIDTGQLDNARELIRQHQRLQRPDWAESLNFWEGELAQAQAGTVAPIDKDRLQVRNLAIAGPVWWRNDDSVSELFPAPGGNAVRIALIGNTFASPRQPQEIKPELSNLPGRLSRALPLWLAEHLFTSYGADTQVLIPWMESERGGFLVSATPYEDESAVDQSRLLWGDTPPDYVLTSHLIISGENWTLRLRFIRAIDGRCISESSHHFAENAFHSAASGVLEKIDQILDEEAGATKGSADTTLSGPELDHYLFRVEQTLCVRCTLMDNVTASFLSNPAEIVAGMIHLAVQNPGHVPSRFLLWRCLDALKEKESELVRSFRSKVDSLMDEYPLEEPVQEFLIKQLKEVFET